MPFGLTILSRCVLWFPFCRSVVFTVVILSKYRLKVVHNQSETFLNAEFTFSKLSLQ